jgi:hypothetical protein
MLRLPEESYMSAMKRGAPLDELKQMPASATIVVASYIYQDVIGDNGI